jgi:hypothetical protein
MEESSPFAPANIQSVNVSTVKEYIILTGSKKIIQQSLSDPAASEPTKKVQRIAKIACSI